MNIKEETEEVRSLNSTNGHFLQQQYSNVDIKLEEDSDELNEASIQNDLSGDIKPEVEIGPISLQDSSNGMVLKEDIDIKFQENLVSHSNKHDYKCDVCHKKFKRQHGLNLHLVAHSNEFNFECDMCHEKFKRKANLTRHLMTHSTKCDFKCDICHGKFKRKENLENHLLIHSNKYDFECYICHGKFKREQDLKQHLMKHPKVYEFKCDICPREFKQKYELKRHLLIDHALE